MINPETYLSDLSLFYFVFLPQLPLLSNKSNDIIQSKFEEIK